MMPKISIIVPIYGVEKFIERCARSLLTQSFEDIEYIFVNDATEDNSMLILRKVLAQYPDKLIKIVNHPINRGLPEARKSGLAVATGDYILHCDSDDWIQKDCCKILYERAMSSDADMVVCGYYLSDGKTEWDAHAYNDMKYESNHGSLSHVISLTSSPFIWNKFAKREIYENPLVFPTHYLAEDWVLSVQLAYYSRKTISIEDKLYYYFVNKDSPQRGNSVESCLARCVDEFANVALLCDWLKNKGLDKTYKAEIVKRKYVSKKQLISVLNDAKFRSLWINTFPETNIPILFNHYIRKDGKILHFLVITGLYSLLKRLK